MWSDPAKQSGCLVVNFSGRMGTFWKLYRLRMDLSGWAARINPPCALLVSTKAVQCTGAFECLKEAKGVPVRMSCREIEPGPAVADVAQKIASWIRGIVGFSIARDTIITKVLGCARVLNLDLDSLHSNHGDRPLWGPGLAKVCIPRTKYAQVLYLSLLLLLHLSVRKAYKKKALQTHPDRLPPGATPEDKAKSEELFRKVNSIPYLVSFLTLYNTPGQQRIRSTEWSSEP